VRVGRASPAGGKQTVVQQQLRGIVHQGKHERAEFPRRHAEQILGGLAEHHAHGQAAHGDASIVIDDQNAGLERFE
jgi:hypothetical protein